MSCLLPLNIFLKIIVDCFINKIFTYPRYLELTGGSRVAYLELKRESLSKGISGAERVELVPSSLRVSLTI